MRLSRGQAFLEGFQYDESAGVLALDIALPIVPEASGSAIGVLKVVVNISTLLASVTVMRSPLTPMPKSSPRTEPFSCSCRTGVSSRLAIKFPNGRSAICNQNLQVGSSLR